MNRPTLLLLAALAAAAPLRAEDAGPPPAPAVAPDSPRASLGAFLDLCRAGHYAQAAGYLDLPPAAASRGPLLAKRLKAVLDRHIWFDMNAISPTPQGKLDDGLPPDVEEIATIPGAAGAAEPVRLVKRADGARWLFSRSTVERIDAWYGRLEHRWILENVPEPLLRPGPRELLWWQWLALPILAILALMVGFMLGGLTLAALRKLASRTEAKWDDALVERIKAPLTVAWGLGVFFLSLPLLALYEPAEVFIKKVVSSIFFVLFFWTLLRVVDMARQVMLASPWAAKNPSSRALVPLGSRVAKVLIVAMGVIAVLSELGYPVASLVAGLGIGGLALALAAQKTVENLFGSFSIGLDQPFREGDFVKIEDFTGTVEAIGLRSTRIRTLDRTLITLPNGKLADMRLENFGARDRFRLFCTLGLVYGTTAAQMREVLAGLERVVRAHPNVWPDVVVVRFAGFGDSSLNVEVVAWFVTEDWVAFTAVRQELFLAFMDVVEQAGTSFAFPTRTVHVVHQPREAKAEKDRSAA